MRKKIIAIVSKILYAQRNSQPDREQQAYDELVAICRTNDIDFKNALLGATKHIRSTVAGQMNGL